MQFFHFEEQKPCQQRITVQLRKEESTSKTLPSVNIIWDAHLQTKYSDSFYFDSSFRISSWKFCILYLNNVDFSEVKSHFKLTITELLLYSAKISE